MNFYSDTKDWSILFKEVIDWDTLLPLYYKEYPTADGLKNQEEVIQFFDELLEVIGDWSANKVYPRAKILDKEGAGDIVNGEARPSAALLEFYKEAKELEAFRIAVDAKYGGMELPASVSLFGMALISKACLSSSTQISFFTSIADMLERFAKDEIRDKYVPMLANGEISGAMCLTEPDCGSDLGMITTSAQHIKDDEYLINGQKIFITNGGGGIGLVLGRIKGAPAGLNGLSLFFVEEWIINESGEKVHNYIISKNEEKMGLHGSFTCEVIYENSKAYLLGDEHQGIKIMFHLMNEARLGVGLQALGSMEAALDYVKKYAEDRLQFGKNLMELPLYRQNFEELECIKTAFKVLMVDTVSYFDIYQRLHKKVMHKEELSLDEKELFRKVKKVVRRRTPIVKFYGAEQLTRTTLKAIQALGGHGFMQDHDLERLHRDSFGPLLYEGTSQIQSLMALKDYIKEIFERPADFFKNLVTAPLSKIKEMTQTSNFQTIKKVFNANVAKLAYSTLRPEKSADFFKSSMWKQEENIDRLMVHAESFCEALSYIEILTALDENRKKIPALDKVYKQYYYHIAYPNFVRIFHRWKVPAKFD